MSSIWTPLDSILSLVYALPMTEKSKTEDNIVATVVILILLMIGFVIGGAVNSIFIAPNADEERFVGACRQEQGHVYYIDQDHKVCLRNGKVVKIR